MWISIALVSLKKPLITLAAPDLSQDKYDFWESLCAPTSVSNLIWFYHLGIHRVLDQIYRQSKFTTLELEQED